MTPNPRTDECEGATNLQPKAEPVPLYGQSSDAFTRVILFALHIPPSPHLNSHKIPPSTNVSPIPGDELVHMNGCLLIEVTPPCSGPCNMPPVHSDGQIFWLIIYQWRVGGGESSRLLPPLTWGVITTPFLSTHTHTFLLSGPYAFGTLTHPPLLYYPCRPQFPSQSTEAFTLIIKYLSWIHEKELLEINGAHYFVLNKRQNK